MRHNVMAVAAAFVLTATVPQTAAAESFKFCMGDWLVCRDDGDAPSERYSTFFDLGIEVNHLPLTREAITQFMAKLTPHAQYVLYRTCQNYTVRRRLALSVYTNPFCDALVSL
jgi:hypothetical protein